ncbi:MAG: S1 RNA-binding domain-containing protein [Candidatus Staskawiczbacteria bacterium]|nr:S1 RNA-binding domain-containing protein [Candidatus Staskawiczbacteria bacterium]
MILKENKIKDTVIPFSVGSTVEGIVVARDRAAIFVDLGISGTGIIYGREFYEAKDIIKSLNIGDKIFAKVIDMENDDGYRELSLKDASKELGWQKLREIKDNGEVLNVKITGVNKGGLLTDISGIMAFLPVSQLAPEHYPRVADADKQKILKELQKFTGKTLEVKILDLDSRDNKLILSEKAKTEGRIKEMLGNYKKGDIVDGQITGVADFGVFIRFPHNQDSQPDAEKQQLGAGQIEGLIHISELDWQLVENPAEIVKIGEVLKAEIIDINNNQVFLSLKSLKENPWQDLESQYKKGDVVKGTVVKFSQFGAFVEIPLDEGKDPQNSQKIRGLCHISEFDSEEKMAESLKIGTNYDFKILSVDPKEHRISLKIASDEK